ncbi:Uncharacterised protein [Mycobacteroides abscessus subsp. abscessus]|nr:Uncharacterised protein [Mycobacteroides abscessus subsp. abscessus]
MPCTADAIGVIDYKKVRKSGLQQADRCTNPRKPGSDYYNFVVLPRLRTHYFLTCALMFTLSAAAVQRVCVNFRSASSRRVIS